MTTMRHSLLAIAAIITACSAADDPGPGLATQAATACSTGAQCPGAEVCACDAWDQNDPGRWRCTAGTCQPSRPYCEIDGHCEAGYTCQGGECLDSGGVAPVHACGDTDDPWHDQMNCGGCGKACPWPGSQKGIACYEGVCAQF